VSLHRPPFVGINELKRRFDVRSVGHAGFLFPPFERSGNFVVPASFAHEFVPNVNVIFGWLATDAEAPLKNFLVGATAFHALD
jgi:hypothetical protein